MGKLSRRQFVVGAAGLGLVAGCGRLPWQGQPARVPRIGVLSSGLSAPRIDAFLQGLVEFGYVEGENLLVEYRYPAGRTPPLPELAGELAMVPVDIIVAQGTAGVFAAKAATNGIPIVSLGDGGDLVDLGLVDSLAHPGGNVTGLTNATDRLHGKRLQLLMEAVPRVSRVAVLWDANVLVPFPRRSFEGPADALGMQLLIFEVRSPEEIDTAVGSAVRAGADSIYVATAALFVTHRAQVMALAAEYQLPAMYQTADFVRAGGLMAYHGSESELHRRGAYYVDRILKGAKPADLPVEQPMRFDFVVNLKTAQAIGITFPNEIMLQVTEVIQ